MIKIFVRNNPLTVLFINQVNTDDFYFNNNQSIFIEDNQIWKCMLA